MGKLIERVWHGLFAAALMVALGFGVQQALASESSRAMLCEGTCQISEDHCVFCCIDHNGSGGQCVGPGQTICLCEG